MSTIPCIRCSNGKYKYGERGNCQFDSLEKCKKAEQAIHAQANAKTIDDLIVSLKEILAERSMEDNDLFNYFGSS